MWSFQKPIGQVRVEALRSHNKSKGADTGLVKNRQGRYALNRKDLAENSQGLKI